MDMCTAAQTQMSSSTNLDKYEGVILVNGTIYRGLIGSLL